MKKFYTIKKIHLIHFQSVSVLYIIILLTLLLHISYTAELEKKTILLINSYHFGYRWTDDVTEGFLDLFSPNDPFINIRVEYMDLKNYNSPEYINMQKQLLKYKYKDTKIDVVVINDNNALELIKTYRQELIPDVPIVFCGINQFSDSLIKGMKNITGVAEDYDIRKTLNLAIKLHPNTKTIAVVCDSSRTGKSNYLEFKKIEPQYSPKYKFIDIIYWTESELIYSLKTLPENTLIMRFAIWHTRDGVFLSESRIKEIWDTYCTAPTYTSLGYMVRDGILGGMLNIGQIHGKLVAEMCYKILNGVSADSIPIVRNSPTRPIFDYRMMNRFGIKESMLPPETIIINRSFTFYEKYKNVVWIAIMIILVLSGFVLVLSINIIMRKKAQRTLAEKEKQYRTLVETIPHGILEIDNNARITFANTAFKKNFQYSDSELLGQPLYNFIPENQLNMVKTTIDNILEARLSSPQYIGKYYTKNGKPLYIQIDWAYKRDAQGDISGFISIVSDITKRIKAEKEAKIKQEQLIQADKMVALGTLVSGVAHEINNPNNFIILNIPILKKVWISVLPVLDEYYETHKEFQIARFPYEQMRDEYFEICSNILDGATRIKTIVKDLKEYSGKEVEGETELIDINKVILSCINLLGNNIKKYTNHLSLELAENLPLIAGKYQHFEQILINLIQNACQALKNRDDSVVIKSIHNNNVVEIYVIDSGIGIAKENLNRIFDPFYTTKRDEGGTGLGLSVSNNLVKKYNGNLTFVSNTAKGTSAIVSFPVKL